jgi:hypothetical protein
MRIPVREMSVTIIEPQYWPVFDAPYEGV